MDANRIQDQSKELVEKLLSADPADLNDAVNQYFKTDAALRTSHLEVYGADKIKQIAKFSTAIRSKAGQVTDKPKYDEKSKTVRYSSTLTYSPQLPSYVPLSAQLSSYQTPPVQWDFVAHLVQADGNKLYVGKLEAKRRNPSVVDRAIPAFILKPIMTFLTLAVVAFVSFFQAHRGEGPLSFIMAAVVEGINGLWSIIAPEIGKRQEQADKWREEKVPQLKQYIQNASSQAFDTASKVQADLEARAKNAGIPIDDYKTRASSAIADLAENVEARAKAAGVPVDEYKKQAEAAIEDLKRRAGEAGDYIQGKAGELRGQVEGVTKDAKKKADDVSKKGSKKDKRSQQDSNTVSQDKPATISTGEEAGRAEGERAAEIRAEFEQTPHTPLGGHDPTAPNAPSFAEAAAI